MSVLRTVCPREDFSQGISHTTQLQPQRVASASSLHKHTPTPPLPTSLRPFKYFSGREGHQCLTRYTVKLTGASTDNDRNPWATAAAAAVAALPPRRRSAATHGCEAVFYSSCGNRLGLHLSGRWWPDVRPKVNIADKYLDITPEAGLGKTKTVFVKQYSKLL